MIGTMPLLDAYQGVGTLARTGGELIDRTEFGLLLHALRKRRGYRRMPDLAEALEREYGIRLSSQGLYMYEQGRSLPPLETITALVLLLKAPGGMAYFDDALRSDIREDLRSLR